MKDKKKLAVLYFFFINVHAAAIDVSNFSMDPLSMHQRHTNTPDLGTDLLSDNFDRHSCSFEMRGGSVLALGDVLEIALCKNPKIWIAREQIKLQSSLSGEAKSNYLPSISAKLSSLKNTTRNTLFETLEQNKGNQYFLSFEWKLFDFGGRAASNESAIRLIEAAIANRDVAIQNVAIQIIQTYYDVVSSQAMVAARRRMAEIAQETLAATRRREARGVTAQGDTQHAATALAKAKLLEQRALGEHLKHLALLKQVMGLQQEVLLELEPLSTSLKSVDLTNLNILLAEAEAIHPAIQQAKAKLESDKALVVVAKSEGRPRVDFMSSIAKNGYPNQGLSSVSQTVTTIGFVLSIPVFDGFARDYKIDSALAQSRMSEAQLRDTVHQVASQVVSSFADMTASQGVLGASQQLLATANEAFQTSQRRYEKNAADVIEVLRVTSDLADAESEFVRSLADWHSAKLRLIWSTGKIPIIR